MTLLSAVSNSWTNGASGSDHAAHTNHLEMVLFRGFIEQ